MKTTFAVNRGRAGWRTLVLGLLLAAGAAHPLRAQQDPLRVQAHYRLFNERHVFDVQGEADYPDGTRLLVVLEYVRFIEGYGEESVELCSSMARVRAHRFHARLGYFTRELYPGRYAVQVWFDPELQPREVKQILPAELELMQGTAEVVIQGGERKLLEMKSEVDRKLYRDYELLQELWQALEARFEAALRQEPFEAEAWSERSKAFRETIRGIEVENRTRREEDIYWRESRGRLCVAGFCEDLRELEDDLLKELSKPVAERKDVGLLRRWLVEVRTALENDVAALGFGKLVNREAVDLTLEAFAEKLEAYRRWRETSGSKPDRSALPSLYQQLVQVVFRLGHQLPDTRMPLLQQLGTLLPRWQQLHTRYAEDPSDGTLAGELRQGEEQLRALLEQLARPPDWRNR